MRYLSIIFISIIILALGCSGQVAKETAKETAKDITKGVESGIKDLAQNIGEAAPYIQEDISEGFWNALDTIGEAMGVPTSQPLPLAGDPEHRKLHAKVDAFIQKGVVESMKRIKEQQVAEINQALAILDQVIKEEMMKAESTETPVSSGSTGTSQPPADIQTAPNMPTPEEVAAAWENLANQVGGRPAAARKLFENIMNYVNTHPEYKSKAGIAGPVTKDKIGEKAKAFLDTLKIGEVSGPYKFMKGYVIIQVLDYNDQIAEVGYIYMPEEAVPQTTTSPSTGAVGLTDSAAPGAVSGSAPSSEGGK